MEKNIIKNNDYKNFILQIKTQIQNAQIKAVVAVNTELLKLYWDIAKMIVEKQENAKWGDGFLQQMSKDLQKEFPNLKGFSRRNFELMRRWYLFWKDEILITKQPVSQLQNFIIFKIPWGQNIVIVSKSKTKKEAVFYLNKTIKNNWSRNVLIHQIENKLFERQGKAINNFNDKLPDIHSDLAKETLKDPYCFDFLTLTEDYNEKELEKSLIDNITKFLLELGQGFSFLGKQYKFEISDKEFYIDLLFYHVKLHSFVVVELKTGDFKPEYIGKLNFYISAIDDLLTDKGKDNPTIGLLICKNKNNMVVEYALKDIEKPIGVSGYKLTQFLPEKYKNALPSIEEIERELEGRKNEE